MKISIGCDHGGYALKEQLKKHFEEKGYTVEDVGTYSEDSCDYPGFAHAAARLVSTGECEKGIVICTTGIGVSMCANKNKGIRCALCSDPLSAKLTRLHNDANMLALGAGIVGPMLAEEIADVFLETEFSGAQRHERRIRQIEPK